MKLRYQYIVCYDIEDNKKRKKITDLLLDLGLRRIQKSVFWGFLSAAEISGIYNEAHTLLAKADRLLITPVNTRSKNNYYIGHAPDEFLDWQSHESI